MKIQVVSDLHLEFSEIEIPNAGADVLILSGDIMIADDLYRHAAADFNPYSSGAFADLSRRMETARRFRVFLQRVSAAFKHVVYVAGNHEFYHFRWNKTLEVIKAECDKFSNIYFLEDDSKVIDGVTFVGSTLWTDMNKGDPLTLHTCKDFMNDFRIIRKEDAGFTPLKPYDTALRHRASLKYIKQTVESDTSVVYVVVGHHAPCKLSTAEQYRDQHLTNGAYSSDLSEFILDHPQIKMWTHGHTHYPFDYVLGETRVVCNPRGYEGYEPPSGWDPTKIFEV